MQRDSGDSHRQGEEDHAWRAIVDNYGDRATLDDDQAPEAPEAPAPDPGFFVVPQPDPQPAPDLGEDRFVPPEPPPLPAVPRDRLAAWVGLFGSPVVLLVCVVLGVSLPALLSYLMVGAFVGGFLYLVVTMPSGPADPWDDGARL